jgi:hypothetical protein
MGGGSEVPVASFKTLMTGSALWTKNKHTENCRKKAQNAQNQAFFFVTSAPFCGQFIIPTKN